MAEKHIIQLNPPKIIHPQAETYLYGHGREIPHVDHYGPAGHRTQKVADHVVFAAVPESIAKSRVILRHKQKEGKSKSDWVS